MGVLDGQPVNQAITNPAFINKNVNDVMPNILGFNRVASGASIADIQATANKLYTATGASESQTGTVYNATPNTITNGDPYQTALTKLANKFDPATGHNHDGTAGMGPILSGSSISDVPFMGFFEPGSTVTGATGTSTNVSSLMVGKFASSNDTTLGVVVDNGHNKLRILAASGSEAYQDVIDGFGNLVYGRITASAATGGIWTLSYFSEQTGVETPYSFAATGGTDLFWWYQELFNPVLSTSVYNPAMEMFAPGGGGSGSGVTSIAASGSTPLTGPVTLSAGAGIGLSQVGQNIEIDNTSSSTAPTTQVFTSAGSYTYNLPSPTPLWLEVTVVGAGGGGGQGSSTQPQGQGQGGTGGLGSSGTVNFSGGDGSPGNAGQTALFNGVGGNGGGSFYGGGGGGGGGGGSGSPPGNNTGNTAQNYGGGGGGGSGSAGNASGAGGGGGGTSILVIPAASIVGAVTVTIGQGGSAGLGVGVNPTAGGSSSFGALATSTGGAPGAAASSSGGADGGAGQDGIVFVKEIY